jgi:hypothetical protein
MMRTPSAEIEQCVGARSSGPRGAACGVDAPPQWQPRLSDQFCGKQDTSRSTYMSTYVYTRVTFLMNAIAIRYHYIELRLLLYIGLTTTMHMTL